MLLEPRSVILRSQDTRRAVAEPPPPLQFPSALDKLRAARLVLLVKEPLEQLRARGVKGLDQSCLGTVDPIQVRPTASNDGWIP